MMEQSYERIVSRRYLTDPAEIRACRLRAMLTILRMLWESFLSLPVRIYKFFRWAVIQLTLYTALVAVWFGLAGIMMFFVRQLAYAFPA